MTDRELLQQALDALESSRVFVTSREKIKHPEGTEWYDERIEALRARLAQPEPEPVDKAGSPCKEFWDWLPKAYRDGNKGEDAKFTKYNMEVAYLAGKQSQLEQKPVAWMGTDIEGNPNKFRLNQFGTGIPLYTAPPQREWQGLTDDERLQVRSSANYNQFMTAGEYAERVQTLTETKLKEKNSG